MNDTFSMLLRYFGLLLLTLSLQVGAAPATRSKSPTTRLSGHVPNNAVANAVFLKNLSAGSAVPLTFVLPLRNQAELEDLLQRIYDPADEQFYGKYLSSDEFVERFAPSQEDYDKVIAYAKSLGLKVTNTHPNRLLLNVVGTTRRVERGLKLRLQEYQLPTGRRFYAPNSEPEVPVTIASAISGIVGLDTHAEWHPFNRKRDVKEVFESANTGSHVSPSGPEGGFCPNDILAAYNLTGVTAKGTGQSIALFELASYQVSDINAYTKYFGLPNANLKNVLVDGGSRSGIDAEVTLDIELALALAPNAVIYVYEGPNTSQGVLDTYNRIATDNLAKQVSTSWGLCEDLESAQFLKAENAIFLQMAAHGQTIYAAAGDSGAYDDSQNSKPLVDDPASQPYVVGVGGTRLSVNSGTGVYASESTWNNGAGNGAGGGGVSSVWPIPSWQLNVSTVNSQTYRNVPDVSLNADPETGYSIFYDGQWTTYGGTSCAAPLWAAFTACVNQNRVAGGTPVLGYANPILYGIGTGASYTANFHDVTSGNNLFYPAHMGYDNATGWGSFNGGNLFAYLTNSTHQPTQGSPHLEITMKHGSPFVKGGNGAYQIVVSNRGDGATEGAVSVKVTLPEGLTYRSFSGSGWTFDHHSLTFTRSSVLEPGSSYQQLTLNVIVHHNAPSKVTPSATVSGGGAASSSATDLTTCK